MPRPPRFTRDDVITCALSIADDQGLEAVTMSAVAALVGVTPMALYRHIDDKEHLLDLLVEAVLPEPSDPDGRLSGWPRLEALRARTARVSGTPPKRLPPAASATCDHERKPDTTRPDPGRPAGLRHSGGRTGSR